MKRNESPFLLDGGPRIEYYGKTMVYHIGVFRKQRWIVE